MVPKPMYMLDTDSKQASVINISICSKNVGSEIMKPLTQRAITVPLLL